VEVQVRQSVRESTVVYLLWVEGALHGTCSLSHVSHEVVTLLVVQLVEVIHVPVISHEASASVCLLFKEEQS
jgi:hypothetical protein